MRILVTGATGFVGGHLMEYLSGKEDVEIYGVYRSTAPASSTPVKEYVQLDLCDYNAVRAAVARIMPDQIYHLAGFAAPGQADSKRLEVFRSNVVTGVNLLEALAVEKPDGRFLFVSSSEVYGIIDPAGNPVDERRLPAPINAYAASKYSFEVMCGYYAKNTPLYVMVARPFNHTGPGQNENFVAPRFAMQIARMEAGMQKPPMITGYLEARKDFLDVRDVVSAYTALMEKGERGGVYNICSGKSISIREIAETLRGLSKIPDVDIVVDERLKRKAEHTEVYGDNTLLRSLTGWSPSIPLEKTLGDLLDDCRKRILE